MWILAEYELVLLSNAGVLLREQIFNLDSPRNVHKKNTELNVLYSSEKLILNNIMEILHKENDTLLCLLQSALKERNNGEDKVSLFFMTKEWIDLGSNEMFVQQFWTWPTISLLLLLFSCAMILTQSSSKSSNSRCRD